MMRVLRLAAFIATPAILVLALWAMHHSLGKYHLADVLAAVEAVSHAQIAWAIALTLLSYVVLTNYDRLAARASNVQLSHGRLSLVSFIAQSCSFTLGHPAVVGTSVRFRFYTGWGVPPEVVLQIGIYSGVSFWLGILAVAGVVFLAGGHTLPEPTWHGLPWAVIGGLLLALVAGFMWACIARRRPLKLWKWELPLPTPRFGLGMIVIGSIDWLITAAVFAVLLPKGSVGFGYLLTVFMLAQAGGILSHVPAGLGAFESVMVYLLTPPHGPIGGDQVAGALLLFRAIYYIAPFLAAVALLIASELWRRRLFFSRLFAASDRAVDSLVPTLIAIISFLAGMMLLVSAFTPGMTARLDTVTRLLRLPVLELAHATSAMVGAGLLVLARGLHHRLRAAYAGTLLLLVAGIAACLLKGLDYEEAAVLAGLGVLLLPTRHLFARSLAVSETLSAKWLQLTVIALIACLGVGLFAYGHQPWRGDLWGIFGPRLESARSLRAASAALAVVALFTAAWFLRTPSFAGSRPTSETLDRAAAIAAASPCAAAHLALVGDKALLFSPDGEALVMYAASGNTWVAMGDPVGDARQARELVWRFRELCETRGARAVFFLAGAGTLDPYVDAELRLLPIGEEARVAIAGPPASEIAAERDRAVAAGVAVEVLPRSAVPAALDELAGVSDEWVAAHSPEKGFACGRFSRGYLARAPVAVARLGGRIVAFANCWPSGTGEEVGVDLLRRRAAAPPGTVEALLLALRSWGAANGYRWLNLGAAPLPGADGAHDQATLWQRVGTAAFAYGELFADAAELRRFKQRFAPTWRKRYLAYSDSLGLPLAYDDIAALITHPPAV